jgi:isoleucyl-tRNA synthetase
VYRDFRNKLFRYSLGNLHDFDPEKHAVPFPELHPLDQYILRKTADVTADVMRWYEEFAFHKIYQCLNTFCIVDLSAFYFDVVKDRLYISGLNSPARRSAQTATWRILEALVRLLAPIMSFTCDEVWQQMPRVEGRTDSVHMAKFLTPAEILVGAGVQNKTEIDDWTTLHSVRDQVLKSLEEARNQKLIGKALEAQVKLTASDSLYPVLERHKDELRYLFIVSQVALERSGSGNGTGGLTVEVSKATGPKCERCWNYSTRVGENPEYPTVCERCAPVLKELEAGGDPPSSKT